MSTCTFFGHRDTPNKIKPLLRKTLIELIVERNVTHFLIGNQGAFDTLVRNTLRSLKTTYPHIDYAIVLAYMPSQNLLDTFDEDTTTVFPEGLETTPPRFAISKRNRWMIEQSAYIVTFVEHPIGGAATFEKLALKKGKTVINLAKSE